MSSLEITHIPKQKLKKIAEETNDLWFWIKEMPLHLYDNLFSTQSYHTEFILNCFSISSFFIGLARST